MNKCILDGQIGDRFVLRYPEEDHRHGLYVYSGIWEIVHRRIIHETGWYLNPVEGQDHPALEAGQAISWGHEVLERTMQYWEYINPRKSRLKARAGSKPWWEGVGNV